jgi:c-di-GMP-binding flagellar brake protein YcgR
MFKAFWMGKKSENRVHVRDVLRPNQTVRLKVGTARVSFNSLIQDIDESHIYISGINDQEMQSHPVFPDEKLSLYVATEKMYYRVEVTFKKKILQPVYLWELALPPKCEVHDERRRAYRLDNVVEAYFNIVSQLFVSQERTGLTRNLSVGGLSMVAPIELAYGSELSLSIPAVGNNVFRGSVMWKFYRPVLDKWNYGIRLEGIAEDKETELTHYIYERMRRLRWAGLD